MDKNRVAFAKSVLRRVSAKISGASGAGQTLQACFFFNCLFLGCSKLCDVVITDTHAGGGSSEAARGPGDVHKAFESHV